MYAGFLQEPKLLSFAYELEQAIGGRPKPAFLGSVPDLPPDAGICLTPLAATAKRQATDRKSMQHAIHEAWLRTLGSKPKAR